MESIGLFCGIFDAKRSSGVVVELEEDEACGATVSLASQNPTPTARPIQINTRKAFDFTVIVTVAVGPSWDLRGFFDLLLIASEIKSFTRP